MSYSQNNEEQIILDYFGDFKGLLLDLGANDGKTFSNSLALIQRGWSADLYEPSPSAFKKLEELHKNRMLDGVFCYNMAVVASDYPHDTITLHDMGSHVGNNDTSLLATTIESEKRRWRGQEFEEVEVGVVNADLFANEHYNFITIDIEGAEEVVLPHIRWEPLRMLCIEYNSDPVKQAIFEKYIPKEFKLIHKNCENLIYAR